MISDGADCRVCAVWQRAADRQPAGGEMGQAGAESGQRTARGVFADDRHTSAPGHAHRCLPRFPKGTMSP